MRLTIYVIIHQVPLICILIGGIFMPTNRRRSLLCWVAGYCDRTTRGLHDRVANELDSLAVASR